MSIQNDLFGDVSAPSPVYPSGFLYRPELISEEQERSLLDAFATLPFREFEFHGYTGKRRTVSFGWHYDFGAERLREATDIPDFLLEVRPAAAALASVAPEELQHVLVTEYGEGAGIGWHRDKAVFDVIVGISLRSPCVFRLRRRVGDRWERVNVPAAPRSGYVLSGVARTEWEHSIPPVDQRRYSITFRNVRKR